MSPKTISSTLPAKPGIKYSDSRGESQPNFADSFKPDTPFNLFSNINEFHIFVKGLSYTTTDVKHNYQT